MRERLATILAGLTAVVVVALAGAFSLVHNAPAREDARPATVREGDTVPATPAVSAGRAVYDRQGCAGCHAIGGEGNPRHPLDGVGGRLTLDQIRAWIVAAPTTRARLSASVARMKQTYADLPEEDLRSLVAYLATLSGTAAGK